MSTFELAAKELTFAKVTPPGPTFTRSPAKLMTPFKVSVPDWLPNVVPAGTVKLPVQVLLPFRLTKAP